MDEPLNILVCEDSPSDEETLLQILRSSNIPNRATVFHSGEELLAAYEPMQYDLLLSDIYMGGITGVEMVQRLRQVDDVLPVAFVTTSDEFALESYRLSALKYIEKPYRQREIQEILDLAKMKRDSAPSLIVHKNGKEMGVPFERILYVEQQTHQVTVMKRDGEEATMYDRLSQLRPQLEENGFVCPHKSFAVNLRYVTAVDSEFKCFVLTSGKKIPIRRESMCKARKAFENYLFQKTSGGTL